MSGEPVGQGLPPISQAPPATQGDNIMTMTKRVLFVVTTLAWGGAESQVIDLASRLKARGWDVAVATLLSHAKRRVSLESVGVSVHTLGLEPRRPDPRALWRLVRLIRVFKPTVVHAHMVHANLLSRIARLFSPVPVLISSAHSTNEGGRWREVAYRMTDRLTDLTTNVSHAAVQRSVEGRAAPPHRIRFMPNGIDLGRFRRDVEVRAVVREVLAAEGRFVWLAVGRFDASKDYPNLLRAFGRVADHAARPLLLMVGEGPLRQEMEAYARKEGLGEEVQFLGRREDVPDLMNAADAYVMSSAWEGLPMVLLEAAASGLPIVATDVGGNAQIVRQQETGELVPAGDSVALAAAMARLMDLPRQVRQQWGKAGATHVRRTFGLDEVVDQWERLYTELYEAGSS